MKAITLYQPYASLVACGVKTIETRSWGTGYRGVLAIHAAKTVPADWADEGDELCRRFKEQLGGRVLGDSHSLFGGAVLPRGAIVAMADLWACAQYNPTIQRLELAARDRGDGAPFVDISHNDRATGYFAHGRVGWLLCNVRALKNPVAVSGQRGLWDVDTVTQSLINKELA